jgi:protein-S-isoprenylcysteine O-methyltransferase Ste14
MKGKILVFIQFFVIFLMILPFGQETKYLEFGMFFVVLGVFVGLLALFKNKLGNFNIHPSIKEGCVLITDGIYAYIRHPMYTSVLTMMFGIAFIYLSWYEIILFFILAINLLVKLFYEESLWRCESEEYLAYSKKTARLVPYIF